MLKASSATSFLIGADRYLSDTYPIETVFEVDFVSRDTDDEVIASTAFEIQDDPFEEIDDEEESSIQAVSGRIRNPSFRFGDLEDARSIEILLSANPEEFELFNFLPLLFPRVDLLGWFIDSTVSVPLENTDGDDEELGDGGDDAGACFPP